jgi:hypothetical protein
MQDNSTYIDSKILDLIAYNCQPYPIIYNCCCNIMGKQQNRHKYLLEHIDYIIEHKNSAELMYVVIANNDIAFAKIMFDNNFKYYDEYLPRTTKHKNPLMMYAMQANRIFIIDMFLKKGANICSPIHNFTLLDVATTCYSFDIINMLIPYNPKSNECVSYLYSKNRRIINKNLSDSFLRRLMYAIGFQKDIKRNEENLIIFILKIITENNSEDLVKKYVELIVDIKNNNSASFINSAACSMLMLSNKYIFKHYAPYVDINNIYTLFSAIMKYNSSYDIKHLFDFYLNINMNAVKILIVSIIQYDIFCSNNDMTIYYIHKFIEKYDIINLLNINVNDYEIDIIDVIIQKYDEDTLNKLINLVPSIKNYLHLHISSIIRHNRLSILKMVSLEEYMTEQSELYIFEQKSILLNKYILKAIRYKSWNVYEYLLTLIEPYKFYEDYAYQNNYKGKMLNLNSKDLFEHRMRSLFDDYDEYRTENLQLIKYISLFMLNICGKVSIYKLAKYYEEVVYSSNKTVHMFSILSGIIFPNNKSVVVVFTLIFELSNFLKGVSNCNKLESLYDNTLIDIINKLKHHIKKYESEYKKIYKIAKSCINSKPNKKIYDVNHKHILFISYDNILINNNDDDSTLLIHTYKDIVNKPCEFNINIFELTKRLKYPTQLPNYDKLLKALTLNTSVQVTNDKIICESNSISIIINSYSNKFIKQIKHYASNIYSVNKDDIYHIYDFSVDKYLHMIHCKIEYEKDRVFSDKVTSKAYFKGSMIINNVTYNGTFEYYTNCYGVTFHRFFRICKN